MKWIFWGWDPGVHDSLVEAKMLCRSLLPAESYIFQFKEDYSIDWVETIN